METRTDAQIPAAGKRAGRRASAAFRESLEHGAGGGWPFLPALRKSRAVFRAEVRAFRLPKGLKKARRLAGESMACLAG